MLIIVRPLPSREKWRYLLGMHGLISSVNAGLPSAVPSEIPLVIRSTMSDQIGRFDQVSDPYALTLLTEHRGYSTHGLVQFQLYPIGM